MGLGGLGFCVVAGSWGLYSLMNTQRVVTASATVDDINPALPIIRNIPQFPWVPEVMQDFFSPTVRLKGFRVVPSPSRLPSWVFKR